MGTADTPAEPMRGLIFSLIEEQVHELGKQHAAGGAEAERHHAHNHDLDGLEGQERGAGSGAAHADAKENGHDVDKLILHRFAQPLRHAALLKEITQHQAGDEGRGRGHQQRHENSHNNGENNLFPLADLPQRLHDDLALLFRGQQLHDGRLNHRNQRHIGVGRHGNGTQQRRGQQSGDKNGRRTVRAADDADALDS